MSLEEAIRDLKKWEDLRLQDVDMDQVRECLDRSDSLWRDVLDWSDELCRDTEARR